MGQPDPVTEPESPAPTTAQVDVFQRTSMAAERTWLAWWRTALTATAGALAVGRFAPELLHVAPWPYVLLGCGYAALALGLLVYLPRWLTEHGVAPPAAEEPTDEGITVHRPLSEMRGPELEYLSGLAREFRSADPAIAALGRQMRQARER